MDDNKVIDFTEMKNEFEESFKTFLLMTDEEIEKSNNFTSKDINELLQLILENLKDVSDLDAATELIKHRIELSENAKARLDYQKDMTKKEIFEENLMNIILLYHAAGIGLWLTSPNGIEFLKRFIVVGLIGFLTYQINASYFASDYRKQKAKLTIDEIDKYVAISKYDIPNINRFREVYIETLKIELSKIYEIVENNPKITIKTVNRILKINRLLNELNLEYIAEESKTKKKIK